MLELAAYLLAQQPILACSPRGEWLAAVEREWGEKLAWQGISNNGASLFVMTLNPLTGSWTFGEQVSGTDIICLRAGGHQYEVQPPRWI